VRGIDLYSQPFRSILSKVLAEDISSLGKVFAKCRYCGFVEIDRGQAFEARSNEAEGETSTAAEQIDEKRAALGGANV
jgi:hypothetical protein